MPNSRVQDGGKKSRANATRLKAVSGVCSTLGVPNLIRNKKRHSEFLSGSDVFVNLPTGYGRSLIYQMAPLVAIELSKQHSRFPNESIVVIISQLLYSGYQLSITRDLQRKNDLTKPKKWCTSIISASLPTVCKIYLKKKSETLQQSIRKKYHFTFSMCG